MYPPLSLTLGLASSLVLSQAPRADPAAFRARATRALPQVRSMAQDATVVGAVVAQNARHLDMGFIRRVDREWQATVGVSGFMKKHLESPCARALRAAAARMPAVVEAFAMDARGALVCSIAKTSDYWQGDEPKWQRSFAGGSGGELVDGPLFDESSQRYSIQISVPVKDGDRVGGALTVGFSLEQPEAKPAARPDAKPETKPAAKPAP